MKALRWIAALAPHFVGWGSCAALGVSLGAAVHHAGEQAHAPVAPRCHADATALRALQYLSTELAEQQRELAISASEVRYQEGRELSCQRDLGLAKTMLQAVGHGVLQHGCAATRWIPAEELY